MDKGDLRFKIFKWAFENAPTFKCGGSVGCSKCSCYIGNDKVMAVQKVIENPNISPIIKGPYYLMQCEKCGHYLREHTWYI